MRKFVIEIRTVAVFVLTLVIAGCGAPDKSTATDKPEMMDAKEALDIPTGKSLTQKYLLVDTHIDVPYRLHNKPDQDVGGSTETGEFDYPRAMEGGLNVPFMSVYIPAREEDAGNAKNFANALIDSVEAIVSAHPDKYALAMSTAEVMENFANNRISLAMGMENGGPIEGDLANAKHFYDRGIRYITLTHSKSNHIADSSYDDNKRWGGLSDFGKQLVPEMNRLGIMVDVSHVSDGAFYDVIEVTETPVIASHSSARHFRPGFERNMDDDMLVKLAENNGVVQLNIGSSFLSVKSAQSSKVRSEALEAYMEEMGIEPDTDAAKAARAKIYAENPYVFATMEDVIAHIDHIVKIAGINHVGIGSDFDGVGDSLPIGFKDVSDYPNFVDALLAKGYTETDIEKILGANLMRVWKEIEAYAAKSS
jgi:membrane dipeptidase